MNKFGAIAIAYEVDVKIMNEPASTVNAVGLPSGIAPNPSEIIEQRSVAGIGQLSPSLTLEKKFEKGVASSRASAHHMRPQVRSVPTRQMRRERRTMKRRQKTPPFVPVAWA